jgi:ribosome-binding factor A
MQSKRQKQFSEVVKRNFGIVLYEKGPNIYGNALVTVTNVISTKDFGLSKIYLSVYNTENKLAVIKMLEEQNKNLRKELARRIRKHVRRIPYIDFYLDETLDEIYKVDSLFHTLKKQHPNDSASEEE